jgi:hypothetical protein
MELGFPLKVPVGVGQLIADFSAAAKAGRVNNIADFHLLFCAIDLLGAVPSFLLQKVLLML